MLDLIFFFKVAEHKKFVFKPILTHAFVLLNLSMTGFALKSIILFSGTGAIYLYIAKIFKNIKPFGNEFIPLTAPAN